MSRVRCTYRARFCGSGFRRGIQGSFAFRAPGFPSNELTHLTWERFPHRSVLLTEQNALRNVQNSHVFSRVKEIWTETPRIGLTHFDHAEKRHSARRCLKKENTTLSLRWPDFESRVLALSFPGDGFSHKDKSSFPKT